MVGFKDESLRNVVAQAVQEAGYEPVKVASCREAMQRLIQASDVDVLLISTDLPNPGLDWFLAQVRADATTGHLPLWLASAQEDQNYSLDRLTAFRKIQREMKAELARLQREEQKAFGAEAEELRKQIGKIQAQLTESYKFNQKSIEFLRGTRVPKDVIAKLKPLIAKEPESLFRDQILAEFDTVLDKTEREQYQSELLDSARQAGAFSAEGEYKWLPPRHAWSRNWRTFAWLVKS